MVDKQPFVTFLTRACCRPIMLHKCIDSVLAQTVKDWEQIFIIDTEKRGLVWANNSMAHNKHRVDGQWVFHLDDDCRLIAPAFIARLKKHLEQHPQSEVVMVKTRRPQLAPTILPRDGIWGHKNRLKMRANSMCHVVRADVWKECIHALGGGGGGSGRFIAAFLNVGVELSWLDLIASETQQLGRGRVFENCKANWWEQTVKRFKIEEVKPQDWRLKP